MATEITSEIRLFDAAALLPPEWEGLAGMGPLQAFNPGLIRDGRTEGDANKEGWVFVSRIVAADGVRWLAICRLGAALDVVSGSQAPLSDQIRFARGANLPDQARHWFADPRLYRLRGGLWLSWNSGWHAPENCQFLMALDPATLRPAGSARALRLAAPRRPVEKNWTFFETDAVPGAVFGIYDPMQQALIEVISPERATWSRGHVALRPGPRAILRAVAARSGEVRPRSGTARISTPSATLCLPPRLAIAIYRPRIASWPATRSASPTGRRGRCGCSIRAARNPHRRDSIRTPAKFSTPAERRGAAGVGGSPMESRTVGARSRPCLHVRWRRRCSRFRRWPHWRPACGRPR